MVRELQFVPVQTTRRADEDVARKFVRSTAMRRFRRRQRLERAEGFKEKKGARVGKRRTQTSQIANSPSSSSETADSKSTHLNSKASQFVFGARPHGSDTQIVRWEKDLVDLRLCDLDRDPASPYLELDAGAFEPIESCLGRTHASQRLLFKHCMYSVIFFSHLINLLHNSHQCYLPSTATTWIK